MPDSGPSMETMYENGLILYSESLLREEERLSACSTDQDCHPYAQYCCRFQNSQIGYDEQFCLQPVAPNYSGDYHDLEFDIMYKWQCKQTTTFDASQFNFAEFRNAQTARFTQQLIKQVQKQKETSVLDTNVTITDSFVAEQLFPNTGEIDKESVDANETKQDDNQEKDEKPDNQTENNSTDTEKDQDSDSEQKPEMPQEKGDDTQPDEPDPESTPATDDDETQPEGEANDYNEGDDSNDSEATNEPIEEVPKDENNNNTESNQNKTNNSNETSQSSTTEDTNMNQTTDANNNTNITDSQNITDEIKDSNTTNTTDGTNTANETTGTNSTDKNETSNPTNETIDSNKTSQINKTDGANETNQVNNTNGSNSTNKQNDSIDANQTNGENKTENLNDTSFGNQTNGTESFNETNAINETKRDNDTNATNMTNSTEIPDVSNNTNQTNMTNSTEGTGNDTRIINSTNATNDTSHSNQTNGTDVANETKHENITQPSNYSWTYRMPDEGELCLDQVEVFGNSECTQYLDGQPITPIPWQIRLARCQERMFYIKSCKKDQIEYIQYVDDCSILEYLPSQLMNYTINEQGLSECTEITKGIFIQFRPIGWQREADADQPANQTNATAVNETPDANNTSNQTNSTLPDKDSVGNQTTDSTNQTDHDNQTNGWEFIKPAVGDVCMKDVKVYSDRDCQTVSSNPFPAAIALGECQQYFYYLKSCGPNEVELAISYLIKDCFNTSKIPPKQIRKVPFEVDKGVSGCTQLGKNTYIQFTAAGWKEIASDDNNETQDTNSTIDYRNETNGSYEDPQKNWNYSLSQNIPIQIDAICELNHIELFDDRLCTNKSPINATEYEQVVAPRIDAFNRGLDPRLCLMSEIPQTYELKQCIDENAINLQFFSDAQCSDQPILVDSYLSGGCHKFPGSDDAYFRPFISKRTTNDSPNPEHDEQAYHGQCQIYNLDIFTEKNITSRFDQSSFQFLNNDQIIPFKNAYIQMLNQNLKSGACEKSPLESDRWIMVKCAADDEIVFEVYKDALCRTYAAAPVKITSGKSIAAPDGQAYFINMTIGQALEDNLQDPKEFNRVGKHRDRCQVNSASFFRRAKDGNRETSNKQTSSMAPYITRVVNRVMGVCLRQDADVHVKLMCQSDDSIVIFTYRNLSECEGDFAESEGVAPKYFSRKSYIELSNDIFMQLDIVPNPKFTGTDAPPKIQLKLVDIFESDFNYNQEKSAFEMKTPDQKNLIMEQQFSETIESAYRSFFERDWAGVPDHQCIESFELFSPSSPFDFTCSNRHDLPSQQRTALLTQFNEASLMAELKEAQTHSNERTSSTDNATTVPSRQQIKGKCIPYEHQGLEEYFGFEINKQAEQQLGREINQVPKAMIVRCSSNGIQLSLFEKSHCNQNISGLDSYGYEEFLEIPWNACYRGKFKFVPKQNLTVTSQLLDTTSGLSVQDVASGESAGSATTAYTVIGIGVAVVTIIVVSIIFRFMSRRDTLEDAKADLEKVYRQRNMKPRSSPFIRQIEFSLEKSRLEQSIDLPGQHDGGQSIPAAASQICTTQQVLQTQKEIQMTAVDVDVRLSSTLKLKSVFQEVDAKKHPSTSKANDADQVNTELTDE